MNDATPTLLTVDEFSLGRSGWARFSTDRKMRYRLARSLVPGVALEIENDRVYLALEEARRNDAIRRVVFLMCNPSTADAFKLDPTVQKCMKFAAQWGAHVLEVVNLYAFRSSLPVDLDKALARGESIGTDARASDEILNACCSASRVIAAWGNNGWRLDRGKQVRAILQEHTVNLEHLGLTKDGYPLHPLARGKMLIPIDRQPVMWS